MGMEKLKNICVYPVRKYPVTCPVRNLVFAVAKSTDISNGIYLLLFFIFMFVFPVLAGAEEYVLVNAWGEYGSEIGQFLGLARIAVDKDGNVYVVDRGNDRIQKFFPDGTFAATWKMSGPFVPYFDIAVDKDGYVYVVCISEDHNNFCIQVFSSNGEFITKWGSKGYGPGEFYYPMGIAVDENGNVYVADQHNNRIQKFSSDGEFITMWGEVGLAHPDGIAVDKDGNVYVADKGNNRIKKFCLILGDCNGDKNVTIDEVQKCINCFLGIENNCCIRCDLDRNGEVSVNEVQKVINALLGIN